MLRLLHYRIIGKEADKQVFKKLRSSAVHSGRLLIRIGENEIRAAVVDGLTGLEKLRASQASGTKYDLIEVMTCPGGCIHGAGLPFISLKG